MNKANRAWVAGILEGEGCFYAHKRRTKLYPRVTINMSDKDVLERFAKYVGFGNVYGDTRKDKPSHWRYMWRWDVSGPKAALLMYEVFPLMCERRQCKIQEVLLGYGLSLEEIRERDRENDRRNKVLG